MIPTRKKLNPLWWLGNIDSPEPRNPDWLKGWPRWARIAVYRLRNPGHNFFYYVIGVADRDPIAYPRSGFAEPTVLAESGWYWHYVKPGNGGLPRPFISYRGRRIEGYIGWRERGNFGIALRPSNSSLA